MVPKLCMTGHHGKLTGAQGMSAPVSSYWPLLGTIILTRLKSCAIATLNTASLGPIALVCNKLDAPPKMLLNVARIAQGHICQTMVQIQHNAEDLPFGNSSYCSAMLLTSSPPMILCKGVCAQKFEHKTCWGSELKTWLPRASPCKDNVGYLWVAGWNGKCWSKWGLLFHYTVVANLVTAVGLRNQKPELWAKKLLIWTFYLPQANLLNLVKLLHLSLIALICNMGTALPYLIGLL